MRCEGEQGGEDRYLVRQVRQVRQEKEGEKERERGLHARQVISPLAAFRRVSL